MKTLLSPATLTLAVLLAGDVGIAGAAPPPSQPEAVRPFQPAPLDMEKAQREVESSYAKAQPAIQEYVLWTARTFGRNGMWLSQDALAALPADVREKRVRHLASVLEQSEYGRHLCAALAEAGALKDKRLVPPLIKVAGYHLADRDYDCRPKWMAVAALARQESDQAVPLLISLVDHGNQNTRHWARAALSRKTGQDFQQDKQAWARWWQAQGHKPLDAELLKPFQLPSQNKNQ